MSYSKRQIISIVAKKKKKLCIKKYIYFIFASQNQYPSDAHRYTGVESHFLAFKRIEGLSTWGYKTGNVVSFNVTEISYRTTSADYFTIFFRQTFQL